MMARLLKSVQPTASAGKASFHLPLTHASAKMHESQHMEGPTDHRLWSWSLHAVCIGNVSLQLVAPLELPHRDDTSSPVLTV